MDIKKELINKEIKVIYTDTNGIKRERMDIIKEIVEKEDGTYNIIFKTNEEKEKC